MADRRAGSVSDWRTLAKSCWFSPVAHARHFSLHLLLIDPTTFCDSEMVHETRHPTLSQRPWNMAVCLTNCCRAAARRAGLPNGSLSYFLWAASLRGDDVASGWPLTQERIGPPSSCSGLIFKPRWIDRPNRQGSATTTHPNCKHRNPTPSSRRSRGVEGTWFSSRLSPWCGAARDGMVLAFPIRLGEARNDSAP